MIYRDDISWSLVKGYRRPFKIRMMKVRMMMGLVMMKSDGQVANPVSWEFISFFIQMGPPGSLTEGEIGRRYRIH